MGRGIEEGVTDNLADCEWVGLFGRIATGRMWGSRTGNRGVKKLGFGDKRGSFSPAMARELTRGGGEVSWLGRDVWGGV
eukprot:747084-Hanusia_phi.AAC.1